MSVPSVSSNPLGYMGIDQYVTPQVITAKRAPASTDIYPAGYEWLDQSQNPANLYITSGGGNWTMGNPQATTTVAGVTRYATNAEAAAHTVSNAAITPSNLPSILASPTAIGATVAAAGTFTTLTATTGAIKASSGQLEAGGDTGGVASTISITNASSTTIGAGAGSIAMSSANPATNTAWIKIYIGTSAYWIPAWTTNAP